MAGPGGRQAVVLGGRPRPGPCVSPSLTGRPGLVVLAWVDTARSRVLRGQPTPDEHTDGWILAPLTAEADPERLHQRKSHCWESDGYVSWSPGHLAVEP
jgi:hypothetical protein